MKKNEERFIDKQIKGHFSFQNQILDYIPKIGKTGYVILSWIARMADENKNTCYPSRGYLAEKVKIHPDNITHYTNLLEKYGLIKKYTITPKKGGKRIIYEIITPKREAIKTSLNKPEQVPGASSLPIKPLKTPVRIYNNNNITKIYIAYSEFINSRSRLTDSAKQKIKIRLKVFTVKDILEAIENFSQDPWWMKHNSHRGVAWFFHNDDRIDQFLNLKGEKDPMLYTKSKK